MIQKKQLCILMMIIITLLEVNRVSAGYAARLIRTAIACHKKLPADITFDDWKNKCDAFDDWKNKCDALLEYVANKNPPEKTPLNAEDFQNMLTQHNMTEEKNIDDASWVGNKRKLFAFESMQVRGFWNKVKEWFVPKRINVNFQPFAQKLILPADSVIAFHGDLHGDIHSLLAFMQHLADNGYLNKRNQFNISNPRFYMIFLGDYVDRGWYGAEVMYTIMRLKIENPDRVFLLRGNHDHKDIYSQYGFSDEIKKKFPKQHQSILNTINQAQELMPVVLYLGCKDSEANITDFIQCCHGGLEGGYNPITRKLFASKTDNAYQLLGEIKEKDFFNQLEKDGVKFYNTLDTSLVNAITNVTPSAPTVDVDSDWTFFLGFMWSDFCVRKQDAFFYNSTRGFVYSYSFTNYILQQQSNNNYKLRGVFRAHQHSTMDNSMMKRIWNTDKKGRAEDAGVGKIWIDKKNKDKNMWPGIVCTFAVTPKGQFGAADERVKDQGDAYGLLALKQGFDNWLLVVVRLKDGKIIQSPKRNDEGEQKKKKKGKEKEYQDD